MPSVSLLRFSRPSWRYRDAIRSYRLEIDGVERGFIKAGGEFSLQVPSGTHTVQARLDWSGSRSLTINAEPDQTVHIRVEPNGCVLRAFYQVFTRQSWIRISQIDTPVAV
jgi:hypothetical protein